MWQLLKRLSRPSRPTRSRTSSQRSFRPMLESLEGREVPTSAGVISAITGQNGITACFAIGNDGRLYYSENGPFVSLSGGDNGSIGYGGFLQVSAALDRGGNAICYTLDSDHSLSVFSPNIDPSGSFHGYNLGGYCLQISGTRNNECYVIGWSHDLWRYDGNDNSWYGLVYTTEPGGFTRLSAGVDQYGNDEVYGVTAYNHVEVVHNDQSFRWLPISASQVSAGIGGNSTGIDLYYVNAADRSLHWYDGTTDQGLGGVCLQICAALNSSGGRECYAIGTDHTVWWEQSWYDWYSNSWHPYWGKSANYQADQISAAADDMVFAVQSGTWDIIYYDPNHNWSNDYGRPDGWYWWYGVAANPNAM